MKGMILLKKMLNLCYTRHMWEFRMGKNPYHKQKLSEKMLELRSESIYPCCYCRLFVSLTLTHTLLCLSTQEKFNHMNSMEARAKLRVQTHINAK